MMSDLDTRLANCFSAAFPDLDPAAIPAASPDATPGWDSMASITLMTLVQEEFNVELDFERFEEFNSYPKLKAWLEANG